MIRLLICGCFAIALLAQSESLLERADEAFRKGDLDRAAALARQAVARDPAAVHGHMILGVIAASRQQWAACTRHFLTVVRLEPANPYGYFYLGQAKLYQQQWEPALEHFAKALERQYPERERLMVEMAVAQNESGRPREALASLQKITLPADERLAAQYHAVMAFAQAKLNQPSAAIEAIRRALQLEEADPHHWTFLISALIKTDQTPQALAEAIRAQKKFPDHADVQYLFALASHYVTESPLSRLALENLREAAPDSPRVLLAEGLLYRKQGKTDEATEAFRRAAERGAPDAHLLLGIVYRENGDYAAALREYREAERLNPGDGQVMLELGKLFLMQGELEQARVRLEKAVQFMPEAPAVHYQLGLLYRRLGETGKAEHHLRLARQP
jgi:tetratricopeptide (TPR) repeat protein